MAESIKKLIPFHAAGLAPMAGVTDAAMRLLAKEQGAAWCVSEMLSAKGWVFSGSRNRNAADLLKRLPGEGVTGLQLFGSDPAYIAEAVRQLEGQGFDFIDLNFGCPAPKITGNGEGSAMMLKPERLGEVVRAAVEATRLPVTVKMRSGWDEERINAPEIAGICEANGAQAVAVHARTRNQQYAGEADWTVISRVKRAVGIPVFGNGDVRSGRDAVRMWQETGCDGVMIGRAAQGNPWIFREIRETLNGNVYEPPSPLERAQTAVRHYRLEEALFGEKLAVLQMRKHIAWYVHGLKGASRFRERVNLMTEPDQVIEALLAFAEAASA